MAKVLEDALLQGIVDAYRNAASRYKEAWSIPCASMQTLEEVGFTFQAVIDAIDKSSHCEAIWSRIFS